MPNASNEDVESRLKSALWYHVGQIVDDETFKSSTNATTQFTGSLTELVWAQLGGFSRSTRLVLTEIKVMQR